MTKFFLTYLLLLSAFCYGESVSKSIAIFTFYVPSLGHWDPDTIKTGLPGSEEAAVYMSQKLAEKGYKVTVFGAPPPNSPYSNETSNPRFIPFDPNPKMKFDIAIAWRMPSAASHLKKIADKVYLWPHDVTLGPTPESEINLFSDVLWISEWQRAQWVSVSPAFAKFTNIYGNAVNMEQFGPITERINPYSCIYGSNYGRGLTVLLDIWPKIKEMFPMATLDIYYGWQHWGTLNPQQEAALRETIKKLESSDVKERGRVGHEELNRAFARASFWTYPCTYPECFAITALRAQASGAVPVIIDGTALKETVRYGYKCATPGEYLDTLTKAMKEVKTITMDKRQQMRAFVANEFTWDKIADKWIKTFEQN